MNPPGAAKRVNVFGWKKSSPEATAGPSRQKSPATEERKPFGSLSFCISGRFWKRCRKSDVSCNAGEQKCSVSVTSNEEITTKKESTLLGPSPPKCTCDDDDAANRTKPAQYTVPPVQKKPDDNNTPDQPLFSKVEHSTENGNDINEMLLSQLGLRGISQSYCTVVPQILSRQLRKQILDHIASNSTPLSDGSGVTTPVDDGSSKLPVDCGSYAEVQRDTGDENSALDAVGDVDAKRDDVHHHLASVSPTSPCSVAPKFDKTAQKNEAPDKTTALRNFLTSPRSETAKKAFSARLAKSETLFLAEEASKAEAHQRCRPRHHSVAVEQCVEEGDTVDGGKRATSATSSQAVKSVTDNGQALGPPLPPDHEVLDNQVGAARPARFTRLMSLDGGCRLFADQRRDDEHKKEVAMLPQIAFEGSDDLFDCRPSIQRFHCTLLFVDISGFTALSTRLDVDALKTHINAYFTIMLNIVHRHGGDVVKFAGDAIYVIWQTTPQQSAKAGAQKAYACATEINAACNNYPVSFRDVTTSPAAVPSSKNRTAANSNFSFSIVDRNPAGGAQSLAHLSLRRSSVALVTPNSSPHTSLRRGSVDPNNNNNNESSFRPFNTIASLFGELSSSPSRRSSFFRKGSKRGPVGDDGNPETVQGSVVAAGSAGSTGSEVLTIDITQQTKTRNSSSVVSFDLPMVEEPAISPTSPSPNQRESYVSFSESIGICEPSSTPRPRSTPQRKGKSHSLPEQSFALNAPNSPLPSRRSSLPVYLTEAARLPPLQTSTNKANSKAYLNVHAGISCGIVAGIDVGYRGRFEYLMAGQPLADVALAESQAQLGEIVLSPDAHALIHGSVERPIGLPVDTGTPLPHKAAGGLPKDSPPLDTADVTTDLGGTATGVTGITSSFGSLLRSASGLRNSASLKDLSAHTSTHTSSLMRMFRANTVSNELYCGCEYTEQGYFKPATVRFRTHSVDNKTPKELTKKHGNLESVADAGASHLHLERKRTPGTLPRTTSITPFTNVFQDTRIDGEDHDNGDDGETVEGTDILNSSFFNFSSRVPRDLEKNKHAIRLYANHIKWFYLRAVKYHVHEAARSTVDNVKVTGDKEAPSCLADADPLMLAEIRNLHILFIKIDFDVALELQRGLSNRNVDCDDLGIDDLCFDEFGFLVRSPTEKQSDQFVLERMQKCMAVLVQVFAERGGQIRQFICDDKGTVCIGTFGLRGSVQEDNAAAAVESAITIVNRLAGIDLTASVGVTSGRAYCGFVGSPSRHEYAVMGPAVNLSARLMCAAQPGTILCDMATRENDRFHKFEKLSEVKAKGYTNPVATYRPLPAAEILRSHSSELNDEGFGVSPSKSKDDDCNASSTKDLLVALASVRSIDCFAALTSGTHFGRWDEINEAIEFLLPVLQGKGSCSPLASRDEQQPGIRVLLVTGPYGIGRSNFVTAACKKALQMSPKAQKVHVFNTVANSFDSTSPFLAWRPILFRLLAALATLPASVPVSVPADVSTAVRIPSATKLDRLALPTPSASSTTSPVTSAPHSRNSSAGDVRKWEVGLDLVVRSLPETSKNILSLLDPVLGTQYATTNSAAPPSPSPPSPKKRRRSMTKIRQTVELLTDVIQTAVDIIGSGRVLIALDDIQSIDSASRTLLSHLWKHANGFSVIVTHRTVSSSTSAAALEECSNYGPFQMMAESKRFKHTNLEPLDRSAISSIVELALESTTTLPTKDTMDAIYEMCGGNPLFACEIAKAAVVHLVGVASSSNISGNVSGDLCADISTKIVTPTPNDILADFISTLRPNRIGEMICFRFDQLSPACQLLLKVASVCGAEGAPFSVSMISYVIPEFSGTDPSAVNDAGAAAFPRRHSGPGANMVEVIDSLHEILRQCDFISVVTRAESSQKQSTRRNSLPERRGSHDASVVIDANTEFEFKSGIVQETIYDLMLLQQKKRMHRRVADYLEQRAIASVMDESDTPSAVEFYLQGVHWRYACVWLKAMACFYKSGLLLQGIGSADGCRAHWFEAYEMYCALRHDTGFGATAAVSISVSRRRISITSAGVKRVIVDNLEGNTVSNKFPNKAAAASAGGGTGTGAGAVVEESMETGRRDRNSFRSNDSDHVGLLGCVNNNTTTTTTTTEYDCPTSSRDRVDIFSSSLTSIPPSNPVDALECPLTLADVYSIFEGDSLALEVALLLLIHLAMNLLDDYQNNDGDITTLFNQAAQLVTLTQLSEGGKISLTKLKHVERLSPILHGRYQRYSSCNALLSADTDSSSTSPEDYIQPGAPFGLYDKDMIFPILSGIFLQYFAGILPDDKAHTKWSNLCEILLNYANQSGKTVHIIRALAAKIQLCLVLRKYTEAIELCDTMRALYKFDEHSEPLARIYGSDRALLAFSVVAIVLLFTGRIKKAVEYSTFSIRCITRLKHFNTMSVVVTPLSVAYRLLENHHIAYHIFNDYMCMLPEFSTSDDVYLSSAFFLEQYRRLALQCQGAVTPPAGTASESPDVNVSAEASTAAAAELQKSIPRFQNPDIDFDDEIMRESFMMPPPPTAAASPEKEDSHTSVSAEDMPSALPTLLLKSLPRQPSSMSSPLLSASSRKLTVSSSSLSLCRPESNRFVARATTSNTDSCEFSYCPSSGATGSSDCGGRSSRPVSNVSAASRSSTQEVSSASLCSPRSRAAMIFRVDGSLAHMGRSIQCVKAELCYLKARSLLSDGPCDERRIFFPAVLKYCDAGLRLIDNWLDFYPKLETIPNRVQSLIVKSKLLVTRATVVSDPCYTDTSCSASAPPCRLSLDARFESIQLVSGDDDLSSHDGSSRSSYANRKSGKDGEIHLPRSPSQLYQKEAHQLRRKAKEALEECFSLAEQYDLPLVAVIGGIEMVQLGLDKRRGRQVLRQAMDKILLINTTPEKVDSKASDTTVDEVAKPGTMTIHPQRDQEEQKRMDHLPSPQAPQLAAPSPPPLFLSTLSAEELRWIRSIPLLKSAADILQ